MTRYLDPHGSRGVRRSATPGISHAGENRHSSASEVIGRHDGVIARLHGQNPITPVALIPHGGDEVSPGRADAHHVGARTRCVARDPRHPPLGHWIVKAQVLEGQLPIGDALTIGEVSGFSCHSRGSQAFKGVAQPRESTMRAASAKTTKTKVTAMTTRCRRKKARGRRKNPPRLGGEGTQPMDATEDMAPVLSEYWIVA
jgi:hypothetical protein